MEDVNLETYRRLIGEEVQYYLKRGFIFALDISKNPPVRRGNILDIVYDDRKEKFCAVIQRIGDENSSSKTLNYEPHQTLDEVPVENIVLNITQSQPRAINTNYSTASFRNKMSKAALKREQNFSSKLTTAKVKEMKVGDDVIWLHDNESRSPLLGKITGIAGSFHERGEGDVVAVVQFDEPTNTFPRYLRHPPENRNIINVKELVPLDLWYESFCQSSKVHELYCSYIDSNSQSLLEQYSSESRNLPLKIRTLEGKTYIIKARHHWTVRKLKKKFEKSSGKNSSQYRLYFRMKQLKNEDNMLSFYNIEPDSIIQAYFIKGSGLADEQSSTGNNPDRICDKINLIGNCLALQNGIEAESVSGVKPGFQVIARTLEDKLIFGEVRMTCRINGQNDESLYVGVRFKRKLGLEQSGFIIKHTEKGEVDGLCEKCKGGKSVFIPYDQIGNDERYRVHIVSNSDECSLHN